MLAGFGMLSPALAATGINEQISFQGKVVNSDGTNVTNGSYTFLFCLYTTGSPATPCTGVANEDAVWRESKSVTVTDGIFQTNLGDTTTLPGSVDFNTDNIYLGINFNGDGQMTPLVRFTAAPYALNAAKVGGLTVTDTTGTLTIPNGETISFAESFSTSGAFATTLTSTGVTNVTLPTTGTLATLAGSEVFTNKTIGSTGLIFSGATSDITTTAGEALTIDSGTTGAINIGTDASAETINIGNTGAAVKTIAIGNNSQANTITIGDTSATGVSITDNNWSINTSGVASFITGSTIGSLTFTTNNIADSGALTIKSATTNALTLDSGTTGTVNIATGTAGKTVNIGTDNTTSDTIAIGSALDNVAITGDQWSVTDAGVLTVVSCSGCGGGGGTLDSAYTAGNTIGTDSGSNVIINLADVATPTEVVINNLDASGANALQIDNSTTLTNGLLIEQSAAGTLSNAIQILETTGTITDGILISGTLGNILNSGSIDITGAGAITGATGITSSGTITLSSIGNDGTEATALLINGSNQVVYRELGTNAFTSGGFATTALDNLASVAINTSLISDTNNTDDLGSDAIRWKDLFLGPNTLHIGTSSTDEGVLSYDTTGNILNIGTDSTANGDIAFFTDDLYLDKSAGFIGINDTTPDALFDFDFSSTNGTAGTEYGANFTVTDTGAVSSGTDTTYGISMIATRTGATGGVITSYGNYTSLTNTFASGSGTAQGYGNYTTVTGSTTGTNTMYGNYVQATGADTTYGYAAAVTATTGAINGGYLATVTDGTTGANTNRGGYFTVTDTGVVESGTDTNYGAEISVLKFGASGGTINTYGLRAAVSTDAAGAGTSTNYGAYVSVTGADTNYSGIFTGGNFGIGDTTPTALLTVGSGDLFQVNSSGAIIAATGITSTTGDITATAGNIVLGAVTRISNAGIGTFITDTVIGSQTFTTNNIADSGALTIKSATTNALTLDSGTTGTINIGTGTAGKAINIGTDNTTSDTIAIGSALDNVAITGDQWSITDAGVLTVVSCSGCGGGGSVWSSIGAPTGALSLSFDAGETSTFAFNGYTTETGFALSSDAGITSGELMDLTVSAASGFTGNMLDLNLSDATGAASNTGNLLKITNSGTANANTSLLVNHYATGTGNLAFRVDDVASDTTPFVIDGAGSVGIGTAAPSSMVDIFGSSNMVRLSYDISNYVTLASDSAGNLLVNSSSSAQSVVLIGDGTAIDSSVQFDGVTNDYYVGEDATDGFFHIGKGAVLGTTVFITADSTGQVGIGDMTPNALFTVGSTSQFQVNTTGAITATTGITSSGAIAANGGITFDAGSDTVGAFTAAGTILMGTNILENIGNNGTDFIATTGALTLAGILTANGGISIGTQALTGTTGNIDYSNFDVTGSNGNTDIGGTITAGSSNTVLTLATGLIDADALTLIAAADAGTGTSSGSGLIARSDGVGLLQGCSDGQVLAWVESTDTWDCATPGGGADNSGLESVQVFTTANDGADAYNESIAGITHIVVELVGAGGGGGGGSTGDAGAGGGAGGYSSEIIESYSANEDVTVGTGGPGAATGATGTTGGTSSFGDATADLQATGGGGGEGDGVAGVDGGAGGVGSNGDINLTGGGGGDGGTTSGAEVGDGGGSYFGGGGMGDPDSAGNAATAPGGGGGGTGVAAANGGAGANGIVIVWEYSGTAGSDYAEYYETDGSVTAGDLVGMGDEMFEYTAEDGVQRMAVLEKASPENRLIGVVSTAPGQLVGKEIREVAKNPRPIALTGRVPTKVSNMNGVIKKGDLLTASPLLGVAMKSTKAGQVIGSAMEDYDGAEGEIGKITVFVNTGYSTGARTKQLLAANGIDLEENAIEMKPDVDKLLLAQLVAQKKDMTVVTPISEIFTDRVVAGLAIITPKVVTQELVVDTISPVEENIAINLTEDGNLSIKNEKGETVMSFDGAGNATFSGTVTANVIRANTIEGLEIYTDSVKGLEEKYAELVPENFLVSSTVGSPQSVEETAASSLIQTMQALTTDTLTVNSDGLILGKLAVSGGLTIAGAVEFQGETLFRKLTSFFGNTLFKGRVTFERTPVFASDTAGFAVIKAGAHKVRVTFDTSYAKQPIVTATLTNDVSPLLDEEASKTLQADVAAVEQDYLDTVFASDIRYLVTEKGTDGFTIVLSREATRDLQFSWVALAVQGGKTFVSEKIEIPVLPDEPIETIPAETAPVIDEPEAETNTPDTASSDATAPSVTDDMSIELIPVVSDETVTPIL